MLEITYRRRALRAFRRMEPRTAQRIQDRIRAVATDPTSRALDIVRLANRPGYRLRVGDWRVIFDMDAEALDVLAIGVRGEVYKPRRRR